MSRFTIQVEAAPAEWKTPYGAGRVPAILVSLSMNVPGLGFSVWLNEEEAEELYLKLEKARDEAERIGKGKTY